MSYRNFGLAVLSCAAVSYTTQADDFRVFPYLQNPSSGEMTVRWLSESSALGSLTLTTPGGPVVLNSTPVQASTLAYNPFGTEPGGPHPALPYMHSVRVSGLDPSTAYNYSVNQNGSIFNSTLSTAANSNQAVRFMILADSETEPESTGSRVTWDVPAGVTRPAMFSDGKYVVDQTTGLTQNLNIVSSRNPNFVAIVGDLVESGGEQRDWDEFWKHFSGDTGTLASRVPLMNALGNHDNYAGPGGFGGYTAAPSNFATAKFTTYFQAPSNGASDANHEGRYSRRDYGKVTLITLDSSNGGVNGTANDTNHLLNGSNAPDYTVGSEQYNWAAAALADAKADGQIVFVQFHHAPYSAGPHGWPAGGGDNQSGVPMRIYSPLFEEFDVAAVFSGHDEMYEHSIVNGIHYYDIGSAGDGLRGPVAGLTNPNQVFLAHDDAPEVWSGNQLISGGKHYTHLEVNVTPLAGDQWQIELLPVYVFPIMNTAGVITGWERRVYDDAVTMTVPEPAAGMMLPMVILARRRRRIACLGLREYAHTPAFERTREEPGHVWNRALKDHNLCTVNPPSMIRSCQVELGISLRAGVGTALPMSAGLFPIAPQRVDAAANLSTPLRRTDGNLAARLHHSSSQGAGQTTAGRHRSTDQADCVGDGLARRVLLQSPIPQDHRRAAGGVPAQQRGLSAALRQAARRSPIVRRARGG